MPPSHFTYKAQRDWQFILFTKDGFREGNRQGWAVQGRHWARSCSAVVPNLGPPDVLGLQLAEAFIITSDGQELKSKNIWRPKAGDHCSSVLLLSSSICHLKQLLSHWLMVGLTLPSFTLEMGLAYLILSIWLRSAKSVSSPWLFLYFKSFDFKLS